MRIDVSEVKTYRECKRKHHYSSRNRLHLRPMTPNDNLIFGTQFHEVLAMMYMGTSLDELLEFINREVTDSVHWKVMDAMLKGYYNGPYQQDKDRYVVVDIEKSFRYPIAPVTTAHVHTDLTEVQNEKGEWQYVTLEGEVIEAIEMCGSIDMICIDVVEGKLVGFEHKTAKNFRPEIYNLVDEQPRVYSVALKRILADYHKQGKYLEITETGPIYLNQVKKLQTKFDYQRVACAYTEEDLANFLYGFVSSAKHIAFNDDNLPEPGFMKCQMCDYASICMHFGYANVDKENVMTEFEGEYEVREVDHLEEKVQRHNTEAD